MNLKYFQAKFGWCISLSAAGRQNAYSKEVTVNIRIWPIFSKLRWTWCAQVDCLDIGCSTQQAQVTMNTHKPQQKSSVVLNWTDLPSYLNVDQFIKTLLLFFTKNDRCSWKKMKRKYWPNRWLKQPYFCGTPRKYLTIFIILSYFD